MRTAGEPADGGHGQPDGATAATGYEAEYARSVYRYWINHLRGLPENEPLIALLGVDKAALELLVEEFIIASVRLDIPNLLFARLKEAETADLLPENRPTAR